MSERVAQCERMWHEVRFASHEKPMHCTPDSEAMKEWPKHRGRPVRVRFLCNAADYWEEFENVSGCDCPEMFELDVPSRSYPTCCRANLEMD